MLNTANLSHADVVVALGGGLTPTGELKRASEIRTRGAINVLDQDIGAKVIILSGGASVETIEGPAVEADVMRQYALDQLVQPEQLIAERDSLETIGNACWTKDITEAHDWGDIAVVTSGYHVPRTAAIFGHVFGPDYKIQVAGVWERGGLKRQVKEVAGRQALHYAFWGTQPGDHEAVRDRLTYLHPRYSGKRGKDLATRNAVDAVKTALAVHHAHTQSA